jgi:hypothetical protein
MTIAALTTSHPSVIQPTVSELVATGDLVDVTDTATLKGFRHRFLVTREVWMECVHWDDEIESLKRGESGQDMDARLCDLLHFSMNAARCSKRSATYFNLRRVRPVGTGSQASDVTLRLSIVPGDDGLGAIIASLPEES